MAPQLSEAELVREYLRERTIGCPKCGYNLRGAAGNNCPECGSHLELRISSARDRIGPWILAVLAVALPLGFAAVITIAGAFGAWRSPYWGPNDTVTLAASATVSVMLLIGLVVVVRRRHRFSQRRCAEQWLRSLALAGFMGVVQIALLIIWSRYAPGYW
jgi:predicted RNA-binding Zn-ribbon protein involved in translation (DUF1610 family)